MLTQKDLDYFMLEIQSGNIPIIYYVAHMIENREGIIDEHIYKSNSKFKVVEIKLNNVYNAYFEYLNYKSNPNNYTTEHEVSYEEPHIKRIDTYTIPKDGPTYNKNFNPRTPSIIYGGTRKVIDVTTDKYISTIICSPISAIYTNDLEYSTLSQTQVIDKFDDRKLDWKYKRLNSPAVIDGVTYNYITSNWYILDTLNFPRVEKPLINVKEHSCYFRYMWQAFDYIKQLEA